jgi:5-enolpyruvylshikimate-3-phosphate synthase
MMLAVAGQKAEGATEVDDFNCADVSNPDFIQLFNTLK